MRAGLNILGWLLVVVGLVAGVFSIGDATGSVSDMDGVINAVQGSLILIGGIIVFFTGLVFLGISNIEDRVNSLLLQENQEGEVQATGGISE